MDTAPETEWEHKVGKICEDLVNAAKKDRQKFDSTFDEVKLYAHKGEEANYYKTLGLESELWFRATVSKTAQALDLMCPYLYPSNPTRTGSIRDCEMLDPALRDLRIKRNYLMTKYLNYTPIKTDLFNESMRAVNQCMVSGGGYLFTGFNERNGLVCSSWADTRTIYLDPDAHTWNDAKVLIRMWEKPRWEMAAIFPKKAEMIAALEASGSKKSGGKNSEMVRYYEIYLLVGIHHYAMGDLVRGNDAMGMPIQNDDTPKKYYVTDNGRFLAETKWEAPFFLDRSWPWPVSPLTFIDDDESMYPISPLKAGLGHQRALNWLYIFFLTKVRFCSRSMLAVMDPRGELSEDDLASVFEMDKDYPLIKIKGALAGDGDKKIGEILQELNFDPRIDMFEKAHAIIKREYEESTGVYDVLHYGESDRQDRSAEATKLKEKSSHTRLDYRKDLVEKWQSKAARREAMVARFLHTPEQINVILGQGLGDLWGQIMPPEAVQAQTQQMAQQQQMQQQMPPMPGEQPMAPPMAQQPPPGVDYTEWVNETDYTIESGSMRRKDIQDKIDSLKEVITTAATAQIQSQDPAEKAVGYQAFAEYYEAIGASTETVDAYKKLVQYFGGVAMQMLAQQQMQQQMAMQQMQAGGPPPMPGQPPGPQGPPPQPQQGPM